MFETSSEDFSMSYFGAKNMSINQEATIKLIGTETTILGSTLNPLVSSSKNLMRPPLDAGSGAPFFLLLIANFQSLNFDINTLFRWRNLALRSKNRYFETVFI